MLPKNLFHRPTLGNLSPLIIILLYLILTAIVFREALKWEHEEIKAGFQLAAEDRFSALEREIKSNLETLLALKAFYTTSPKVTRSQFRDFVAPLLSHHPSIQAIEWISRVTDSQRDAYEAAAKRDGIADFEITEVGTQKKVAKANKRKEYFPVYFVEPYKSNENALGFDLASNPTRLEALELSRRKGEMVATGRITLVQETGNQFGALVFVPVYRTLSIDPIQERPENLEGFVLGVFRIGDLLENSLTYLKPEGINIYLYDKTASERESFLYSHKVKMKTAVSSLLMSERADENKPGQSIGYIRALDFANRKWELRYTATPAYIAARRTWQPWGVLLGGLVLTGLLAAYSWVSFNRNKRIEQLVIDRTKELQKTNERLAKEISVRTQAEEALRKGEEEARRLAEENAILAEIGRIISSTPNIEKVYKLFSEKVKKLLPYDRIAINLIDKDGNALTDRYVEGEPILGRNMGDTFPMDGTLTEVVIQNRRGLIFNSQDENKVAAKYPGLLPEMRAGFRSFLSIPLISGDKPIGGLHFRSKKYRIYSEKDLKLAENIANQVAGAIANAQLFSEQERADKEKASLQQQLHQSQKMEAIGKLAGGIAHDFNNLLTIINTHAQLALMELKSWDPMKGKLESIQKAGERAANLTRQLLAFSRRQVVDMKVIDLNDLLQELGKMLSRIMGEDIELSTVLDKGLGRVKADPGQMEQVILNLVVNAKDAMPFGGKLTIETTNVHLDGEYAHTHFVVKPGRYVMLSVSDTGVGMSPEVRERVFEPFFTTKEKGKGTGLGLSTVYGVVKQSGGYIWVYSEPGQGATFKIYLPRVDEPLEGKVRKKAGMERLPRGRETVLLVEDEEEVRNLAVAILQKQGYRILEAANGGDAFLICEQGKEKIQLLLTDVIMPGLNGPELARRLGYFYPEMKVLYMSGYTDNAIFQQGVLDEKMPLLQKPFSVEGLVGKVREALDR